MKILIAPDKFKGSLTADEVCEALTRGLHKAYPSAIIQHCPLADGGDGSLAVLKRYLDTETITVDTLDPLGRPIRASYLLVGITAYIELAAASGLALLTDAEFNCMRTSTLGTGILMEHAIKNGARELYLFIGGSATNDGGMGIAAALGYRFFTDYGVLLRPNGHSLYRISKIDNQQLKFDLQTVKIKVICDVDNPFYGPQGAAYTYAAQKGAKPKDIVLLDKGLVTFSKCLVEYGYPDISQLSGAGAAGGVGGGAVALLNAQLLSGTATFLEISQLEKQIEATDLVITGEGKLDQQTVHGKLIQGICVLAQKHEKPVIGICGLAEGDVAQQLGMRHCYAIMDYATNLTDAIKRADQYLEKIGERLTL